MKSSFIGQTLPMAQAGAAAARPDGVPQLIAGTSQADT